MCLMEYSAFFIYHIDWLWLERVFIEMNLILECIWNEWIFRGVQQIVVWVWLVCVPGLFLSPFYYNLGAQLSVQSSTQNHIVIWMRVNVKCQHLFAFAFSLSSTRSSRYVVSLISIALIHLQILLLSSFPCLDGPKNMLNHTFLLSLVTLRCRCNFTST